MSTHIAAGKDFITLITALPKTIELDPLGGSFNSRFLKFRCHLVHRLCAVMLFPKYSIRNKMLDPEEYAAFPTLLRKRMVIATWLTIVSFLWGAITYTLIKSSTQ